MPNRRPKRAPREKKKREFMSTVKPLELKDPDPHVIHKSVGRKTKLGICSFCWNLFHANEELPRNRRLTNTALEYAVREEYSHRKVLIDSLDCKNSSINDWRRRYNRGILIPTLGQPLRVSLRYNNDGSPVEPRLGRRVLSDADVAIVCESFEIKDDRYTSALKKLSTKRKVE